MGIPLVSVLMTAYNREKYIGYAIESVLASTYTYFELIIVDDCSNDQTVAIANGFKEQDSRVHVFVNKKNLGDYPNRNKAASYANGKYLKYLDSDDIMAPNCLGRMVHEMETHNDCVFGISSRSIDTPEVHQPLDAYKIHFFERGILDISPSGSIIRNDIFKKENGFWELRCISDFEFWLRLSLKYPMIELEKNLIFWREHDQQEIKLGNIEYLKHSLSILTEKVSESQLTISEKKQIIQTKKKETIRYLLKNIFNTGLKKSIEIKNLNKLSILDAI